MKPSVWKNIVKFADYAIRIFSAEEIELPVDPEIVARERKLNAEDPGREAWILRHTYLCEGGLEELGKTKRDCDMRSSWAYYTVPQGGDTKIPCKRVIVSLPCTQNIESMRIRLEKALKLALVERGSGAGVYSRFYKKGKTAFAGAIPATLTGE